MQVAEMLRGDLSLHGKSATAAAKPVKSAKADNARVRVWDFKDQFGTLWIAVRKVGEKRVGWGELKAFAASPGEFRIQLIEQGVILVSPVHLKDLRNAIGELKFTHPKQAHLIDRLGWHHNVYAWPGRELHRTIDGVPIINRLIADAGKWGQAGSLDAWLSEVRRLCNGQFLLTTVMAHAFVGPLLRFFPAMENIGLELITGSSTGKSTGLLLAGSVWGGRPDSPEGFSETWNTTANGLEPTVAAHADGFLALDELNLLDVGGANKASKARQAVFFLASGTEKQVKNATRSRRSYRLAFLSSSNETIAAVVGDAIGADVQGAVQVRLITLMAKGGLGIFNQLPQGCVDGTSAVAAAKALAFNSYGFAGRRFVERLEGELANPENAEALTKKLEAWSARFKDRAGLEGAEGPEVRVAEKFAIIFAAGSLAKEWGLLPIDAVGTQVLRAYRHYQTHSPQQPVQKSALEVMREYARRHKAKLHDITGGGDAYPDLDKAAFNEAAGFIKRKGGETWLLVSHPRFDAAFGVRGRGMLRALKRVGRLRAPTEGFLYQMVVCRNKKVERVHMIKLRASRL